MLRTILLTALFVASVQRLTFADPWPTLLGNNQRNAYSPETIDPTTLRVDWIHSDHTEPTPAWYGPAKWDAYATLPGLRSMRDYDVVDHVIAVQDGIFVGSSTAETVERIDGSTGERHWAFFTGGPVRVAPTWHAGKIYFGSDDGFVYCLRAVTGELLWKHRPCESERWIVGDGRLIPFHPVRTGVLIQDGIAYYGASLLPWRSSYLCAVDAETGTTDKPGCFVQKLDGRTFEGALACTDKLLISPQGRVPPEVYSRRDGRFLGSLDGGGGSFVVIAGDQVLHGPGNKAGWMTSSNPANQSKVASFPDAKSIVALPDRIIMQTSDSLVATDNNQKPLWTTKTDLTLSLAAAGETLFVGGKNRVAALSSKDGSMLWQHAVQGRAYGLAWANDRLIVSTDEGVITAFRPADTAEPDNTEVASAPAQQPSVASPPTRLLRRGPTLEFIAPQEAVVRYETRQPTISRVILRTGKQDVTIEDETPKTTHAVRLTDLDRNQIYRYCVQAAIDGVTESTEDFECDTFFNYAPLPVTAPKLGEEARRLSREVLAQAGIDRGLCLLVGDVDLVDVSLALAGQTKLRVVGLLTDPQKLAEQRRRLLAAGGYGRRVTLRQVDSLEDLPVSSRCMNLVVSFGNQVREVPRLLAPGGIGLLVDANRSRVDAWARSWSIPTTSPDSSRVVAKIVGRSIPGSGEWSHIYGAANNAAYGGESLSGARTAEDFAVQWIGRPGPRYQADRNGRKTPPLSAGGRLYLQGLRRIVTLDRYNGSILWSLEIPAFGRYNIPRDCGNWCADEESLLAVVNDECWQLDGATGAVQQIYTLPPPSDDATPTDEEWGFVARTGDLLIGTAAIKGSSWAGFWGKEAWYDGTTGPVTDKVCSRRLFAVKHRHPNATRWQYQNGAILNATMTVTDESLYFVESRNPALRQISSGRVGEAIWKDQYLVSLDSKTGKPRWEVPVEFVAGKVVFYLAHGSDTLVAVSSADRRYHVYALDPSDGSSRWHTSFTWGKGKADHGSHLSRPAIVGKKLFVRPAVIDLATGEITDQKIPVAGCGTYACTDNALFFRGGSGQNFSMWDAIEGKYTQWFRLRPDCWLSTIPAGGMLLSPEGGGGCSCGKWLETSIGFIPKSLLE